MPQQRQFSVNPLEVDYVQDTIVTWPEALGNLVGQEVETQQVTPPNKRAIDKRERHTEQKKNQTHTLTPPKNIFKNSMRFYVNKFSVVLGLT